MTHLCRVANLLCIETSGEVCSVAIFRDRDLVNSASEKEAFQHAAVLTVLIEKVCSEANIAMNELNAIAVSSGPGSYTGLRIGTSVSKGLCYALEIPLIALDTLEIIAHGFSLDGYAQDFDMVCPLVDARRMEVYSAVFDSDLNWLQKGKPEIITEDSFANWLAGGVVYFIGSGAVKTSETIKHVNARFVTLDGLSARFMGALAYNAFQENAFADLAYFEPNYLKEFYTTAKPR